MVGQARSGRPDVSHSRRVVANPGSEKQREGGKEGRREGGRRQRGRDGSGSGGHCLPGQTTYREPL